MKLVLLLACTAVAGATMGCSRAHEAIPSAAEQKAENPLAGLHTPGSEIGLTEERRMAIAAANAAGAGGLSDDEQDLADAIAMGGDRCVGAQGAPGTPSMLTVSFRTESYGGKYKPENCGAVWIEDAAGHYIATPYVWSRIRLRPLFFWQNLRCAEDKPDVLTGATPAVHKTHEVTWDGKDLMGKVVPDGMYVVNIEVTEDELATGRRAQFTFNKGGAPETTMPPAAEFVKDVKLVYTPTPTTPGTGLPIGS